MLCTPYKCHLHSVNSFRDTARFTQSWCFFHFHEIFDFYDDSFQNLHRFASLYFLIFFFKSNLEIFWHFWTTWNPRRRIQDGGVFKCMTSFGRNIWRHNLNVAITKINIFRCFTHHISFIFIAWIHFEAPGGCTYPPEPDSHNTILLDILIPGIRLLRVMALKLLL